MASISSSADDSSSSADEEMEHHPTINLPTPPVPSLQETDASEEESDVSGSFTKRLLQPRPPPQPHWMEGSGDEDEEEGSDSDEEASEGNVPSPELAEAYQKTGGDAVESSDEIGENGVVIKRIPHPPPPQENDEEEESDTESDEASSTDQELQPEVNEVNAPSPHLANSPPAKRKAATAEFPMSTLPRKTAAVAPTEVPKPNSPPSKKAAAVAAMQIPRSPRPNMVGRSPEATVPAQVQDVHRELQCDAEKHLEEKSNTYRYLWQEVLALGAEHPGMCFKREFLKIPDDKAHALNTKIKRQEMSRCKVHFKRWDIEKEIIKTLMRLME
ncbi:hypothetical protein ACP4OV_016677 [Aristida adscensionis]